MRVHESGHTIVGHVVGLTIGEPTANFQGVVPAWPPNDMTEYQGAISLATFYAAGLAAEREVLSTTHPDFGQQDLENIQALKTKHPKWTDDIDDAVAAADETIRAHRAVVDKLTERFGTFPRVKLEELNRVHLDNLPVQRPPRHPTERT